MAEEVLANLAPMSVEVARSREDVDAVLRMRYECVVAQGWVRPSDYPDGRERDADDEGATFVVCRDDDEIIGCMRLVPPRPDRPLPTEREFRVRVRPAGKVAEAGRIIVSPRIRAGRSHLVIGGLCARGWLLAREQGYERAVSTATPELIELYRGLGLSITVLGPPQMHWGEERVPIQIDGAQDSFGFLLTGSATR
jgi:N-acyl-L-homoserine lactone synthetase